MSNEEWKRRCEVRILREVRKAGRLRIRELKRRTHYSRGPEREESGPTWYEALDKLERAKRLTVERDADGFEVFVRLREMAPLA